MSKKIKVTNLSAINTDPLRKDQGEWYFFPEGLGFQEKPNKRYSISYGLARRSLSNFGRTITQTITIDIDQNSNQTAPNFFSENDLVGKTYEYFVTTLETDLTYQETINRGQDPDGDPLDVKFQYNFLDQEYENLLANVTDHNLIPNIYAIYDQTYINQGIDEFTLRESTAEILNNNISLGSDTFELLTNQVVSSENNDFLKEYGGNRGAFPMYCEISLPFRSNTSIASALEDSNLGVCLVRDIFGGYNVRRAGPLLGNTVLLGPPDSVNIQTLNYSIPFYNRLGQENIENANINALVVNLDEWILNDLPSWYVGMPRPNTWSFLGLDREESDFSEFGSPIELGIYEEVLQNSLDSILGLQLEQNQGTTSVPTATANSLSRNASKNQSEKTINFQGMVDGRECYSETLMFKVIKYLGSGTDNPIQTFYFTNTRDLESFAQEKKISFIDTQVKYNQEYTYSITVIQAVVANRYVYGNPIVETDKRLKIDVSITPFIKLVEMPYFQVTGRILSNPPLSPQITFAPIKGRTNLIKFNMDTNTGTRDLPPIALNSSEVAAINQLILNQRRTDGLITFRTDDYNRGYNIYRMSEKPLNYQDFGDKLLVSVSTKGDSLGSDKEAGAASIIIKQNVNQKYYYMFRSIDSSGFLSNPSEVYEIELYNDGGAGYPIIREYAFKAPNPKTTTKAARKMIQIIPRISQAYLNEQASNISNSDGTTSVRGKTNMSLGVEDESLFATTAGYGVKAGKRFKIRITSKSTGKKLDINVDFNTNRVRSEIE